MSGKVYGPTYAVTSRSSGRRSPSCSSVTRRTLPGPRRFQLVVAGAQTLGQDAGLADGGHEIRVAEPSGQHVHVQMVGHARTGRAADVGTDVHAVGVVRGPYGAQGAQLCPRDRDVLVF